MKSILFSLLVISLCSFSNYTQKINIAEVNQVSGLYIFVDSRPIGEYEYLGSCKVALSFTSGQYQPVRDRLIKKVKSDYPNANAVIIHFHNGGTDIADAILIK